MPRNLTYLVPLPGGDKYDFLLAKNLMSGDGKYQTLDLIEVQNIDTDNTNRLSTCVSYMTDEGLHKLKS